MDNYLQDIESPAIHKPESGSDCAMLPKNCSIPITARTGAPGNRQKTAGRTPEKRRKTPEKAGKPT